jgi:hypothetical protein
MRDADEEVTTFNAVAREMLSTRRRFTRIYKNVSACCQSLVHSRPFLFPPPPPPLSRDCFKLPAEPHQAFNFHTLICLRHLR